MVSRIVCIFRGVWQGGKESKTEIDNPCSVFYLLSVNFGTLLREQPHSPDVNHCIIQFQAKSYPEHAVWEGCL